MASLIPHFHSRRRAPHSAEAASQLIAATQMLGLAGAIAFISLFAVFAAASEAEPLARAAVLGLFLVPLSLLVYFMREAAGRLRPLRRERRRRSERANGLVIDA
jgi:hypothetical protein